MFNSLKIIIGKQISSKGKYHDPKANPSRYRCWDPKRNDSNLVCVSRFRTNAGCSSLILNDNEIISGYANSAVVVVDTVNLAERFRFSLVPLSDDPKTHNRIKWLYFFDNQSHNFEYIVAASDYDLQYSHHFL